jgi:hypothetical protein
MQPAADICRRALTHRLLFLYALRTTATAPYLQHVMRKLNQLRNCLTAQPLRHPLYGLVGDVSSTAL